MLTRPAEGRGGRSAGTARRGAAARLPLRCRRGAPAIEFALVCPILLLMLVGVNDVGHALITLRRLTLSAQEAAEAAATMGAPNTAMGVLTTTQANTAMAIAAANLPQWLGADNPGYGVTLSSIALVASPANCTTGCTYTAQTAWSLGLDGGLPVLRPCGTISTVANTTAVSLTTLPVGLLNPPAILVVDLSTVYRPTFSAFITGPITMMRSAYIPPRATGAASYVSLTLDGASYTGHKCSGFP